jgi:hypothetical protein
VDAAVHHGVAPLLHHALVGGGRFDRLAPAVGRRLTRLAQEAVLVETIRSRDLLEVGEELEGAGLRPLIFKGGALAVSHYPAPWLRVRGDSDLLVRRSEVEAACHVLERRGLRRLPRPRGTHVTQQARYCGSRDSIPIAYDVHWRVADPHAFAGAAPYLELERSAVRDRSLGLPRPANVHALLVACIHRVAHHYDSDYLLFLYDIALLAEGLTPEEWTRFAWLAEAKQLKSICLRGLEFAADAFGISVPAEIRARLLAGDVKEPTAVYASGRLRRVDILRSDFRALDGWKAKTGLIWGHCFPEREFLMSRSTSTASVFWPVSYLSRIFRGARGWFEPLQ